MMTNLWVYDGGLDAAEKVLTLDNEGPSFADPDKKVGFRTGLWLGEMTHFWDVAEKATPSERVDAPSPCW